MKEKIAENAADEILRAVHNPYFAERPDELRASLVHKILGASRLMAGESSTR